MKTLTQIVVCLVLVLILDFTVNAKEWRGIVPLRSTRADVVRLLNQCVDQTEACHFKQGNEDVFMLFAEGVDGRCPELLPETVMFVDVILANTPKMSDLKLDKKKLYYLDIYRNQKSKEYFDDKEGLVIDTLNSRVTQLVYLPTAEYRARCSWFYHKPSEFVHEESLLPYASIDCSETIVEGERLELKAFTSSTSKRGIVWTVSAGKIVFGRLLKRVVIDTSGLAGRSITVTAEVNDGNQHTVMTSCVVKVTPRR